MKAKSVLVAFLVAALALIGTGCSKTTGGGWFIDEGMSSGNKITFGFNAQPTGGELAKGQFQLIDHGSKVRIHGSFEGTYEETDPIESFFWGTCTIDGEGPYSLQLRVEDLGKPGFGQGDMIDVFIFGYGTLYGELGGGNIKGHKK